MGIGVLFREIYTNGFCSGKSDSLKQLLLISDTLSYQPADEIFFINRLKFIRILF